MTATHNDIPSIESVDAFAKQLYRRTRAAGSDFAHLTTAIRSLHAALRHLHAEVQDPDSPLHQPESPTGGRRHGVYARQLASLAEDSDFTLKQVSTVLDKHIDTAGTSLDPKNGAVKRDPDPAERSRKIDLIQGNVVSQKMKIDIFLDTVQLHTSAKTHQLLDGANNQRLDMIRNKVDAIANRLFRTKKRESPVEEDDEDLWQRFKAELEHEGFSSEVLHRNKVRYYST